MHLTEEAGEKEGQETRKGARFMSGGDTQKQAKLPLVRKQKEGRY